jgi:hypothetical protein
MWRMQDGNRVLNDAEWKVFRAGLAVLHHCVEMDINDQTDDTSTGVPAFDRSTAEQKLALLAEVARAVRDPSVPIPSHTAANEAALMAVLVTFLDMLRDEVDSTSIEPTKTDLRGLLLAAISSRGGRPRRLPIHTNRRREVWDDLHECLLERIFWDRDFDLGDEFLDLPPEVARAELSRLTIDPDYFLAVPDEPTRQGLITARQTLAGMLGLPVPDDDGLYPMLLDFYHDLTVGSLPSEAEATWADRPWFNFAWSPTLDFDCDYRTWLAEFSTQVPIAPFEVVEVAGHSEGTLPDGWRVEQTDEGWVVRDERGAYWCGLEDNGWTDAFDEEMPALTFQSSVGATAAVAQAGRMYADRAGRREAALTRIRCSAAGA